MLRTTPRLVPAVTSHHVALLLCVALCPAVAHATFIVHSGWDLLQTTSASFDPDGAGANPPIQFTGVPLGTHNFGGTIGSKNVGSTDTIIQRQADAVAPGVPPPPSQAPAIPIELVALQLQSVNQVNVGFGPETLFVTLQKNRTGGEGPATPSPGNMTITFGPEANPHGTFASSLNVNFDMRRQALNGPIFQSGLINLANSSASWGHVPPPGSLVIDGVNHNLNGVNMDQDFWSGLIVHDASGAGHHNVSPVPEPSQIWGASALVGCLALREIRKRMALRGKRKEDSAADPLS